MQVKWLLKWVALFVVLVLLWIGLGSVQSLVRERIAYRDEAVQSVLASSAGQQQVMGPLIHMSCVESWELARDKPKDLLKEERREFFLVSTPQSFAFKGNLDHNLRYRGIHEVNSYTLRLQGQGEFTQWSALQPQREQKNSRLQCGAPILMFSIRDARGIREASVTIDGTKHPLKAGTFHPSFPRGVHLRLPDHLGARTEAMQVVLNLELAGAQSLSITPTADNNQLALESNWPHPSFQGQFLPTDRQVTAQGFQANWKVSALASNNAQVLQKQMAADPAAAAATAAADAAADRSSKYLSATLDSLGVSFIDPINVYSLSDRASKYGLLFVVLTFVAIALTEVLRKLQVHPVQYFLVGAAVSIFFLLLLALSEHWGFAKAYLTGVAACVGLLTYYGTHMLSSRKAGFVFGLGFALLYGLLYVLLQLEQTALAVGAVALFVVLGVVMVSTRRVNWHEMFNRGSASAVPTTPKVHAPPMAASAADELWRTEK
jgi:inner membrane protein